jgi:undecaprenyl-diphosphatase
MKIALHAGSLITLLIFFRKEIADILLGLFSKKKPLSETHFFQLFLGAIPVAIIGFCARNYVKEFDAIKVMGFTSIVFGILLVIFDMAFNNTNQRQHTRRAALRLSIFEAIVIGLFQSISIFPGVSRLGICITAARMMSMNRTKAIHFSLFFAIPSIFGSIMLEIIDILQSSQQYILVDILLGIVVTSIVGLLVIRPCISYMEKQGFLAIAIYRILIGAAIYLLL